MKKKMSYDAKKEAIKQWDNDPCGFGGGNRYQEGSREFFDCVDKDRYQNYAPWLPKVMEFDMFSGKRLLEVGFGMGTDLYQFAKNGANVYGVDLVPRHLEIAKKRFALFSMKADLQLADTENLPFDDEYFDAVY